MAGAEKRGRATRAEKVEVGGERGGRGEDENGGKTISGWQSRLPRKTASTARQRNQDVFII